VNQIEKQWNQIKLSFPIGYKFWVEVLSVKPFGIFVSLTYQNGDVCLSRGIIDVATHSDDDSFGLPENTSEWPQVGQKVYCKVIAYRDYNKEVDLRLAQ